MNTKEAAERFHLDINEVRKRKKDGMIIGASVASQSFF